MGMGRLVGLLLGLAGLAAFTSAEGQSLCLGGKVVAVLDGSNRVVTKNAQGELTGSQGGSCTCQIAADNMTYLSCQENQWPAIAQLPPNTPMMCASGRNDEGFAVCPTDYSPMFQSLVKNYDLVSTNKGSQQISICDKKSGTKVGSMEKGLFQRDPGTENTFYTAVTGCSCVDSGDKGRLMTCDPFPVSLSTSYKNGDGQLLCVDGIACPAPKPTR
ncbi:hypothetical protein MJO28_003643 [Puccinia striiformis f. sp. tritici]|nr:hypothetical protein Pst134EA_007740 [Puccinia striiformis f. sp. tritici]KAH9470488.1 hypothetical protein Pst134EA_007740 [Puccinia striiformis f. sp. tritici]KAI7956548.1 hypothetical protein MJO28_003643 [Puccinia striiformis f. sp. tritici]KNE91720.1 hypothetical protein PSTG_14878 [Puccinia striiformis f. sp. tritici PST-78]POW12307.1 hypothetical protein PSTT_04567 [Puccinia striiformis]